VPSFPLNPTGYIPGNGWRPLRKKEPYQRGWDVYDLQSKLNSVIAYGLVTDGIFGPATDQAVRRYQTSASLLVDGVAGTATQTALTNAAAKKSKYPQRALGQIQKESSALCGIYTPQYPNGSFDTGPLQENTQYHPDLGANFHIVASLGIWEVYVYEYVKKYRSWGVPEDRCWAAAQGAWNNPSYADAYARGRSVPQSFLDYIDDVTVYV